MYKLPSLKVFKAKFALCSAKGVEMAGKFKWPNVSNKTVDYKSEVTKSYKIKGNIRITLKVQNDPIDKVKSENVMLGIQRWMTGRSLISSTTYYI